MKTINAVSLGVAIAGAICAAGFIFLGSALPADSCLTDKARADRRPHDTSLPALPESLDFCGEEVPLSRQDVRESLDREIIATTFLHSSTLLNIKRSGRFFPLIDSILAEMSMPADLKYLCVAESNLSPTAGSPVGARGLWQFMEVTGREYGLTVNDEIDERLSVEKSTRAACRMMRDSYVKLGSWTLAAAAYNGGQARVRRRMDEQHQQNYYDILFVEETARYVFRILAYKTIMSDPRKYGFDVDDEDKYSPYKTRTVELETPQADLSQWAIDHGSTYKELRTINPWITKPALRRNHGTLKVELSE